LLQTIGDFPRAIALLLEFIECSALSKSNEVSLAALKSFQEILYNKSINSIKTNGENDDLWNVSDYSTSNRIKYIYLFYLS